MRDTVTNDDTTDTDATEATPERRPLKLEWHPDALRPPFEWTVELPPDWAVVETHPARWKRQNERIVDDYFDGRRVAAKIRRELLRALGDAVAAAQQKKVLLTLVKPGVDDEGQINNLALTLMFSTSSPRLASMAPIKRAFGSGEAYTERTTPAGNAYATTVLRQRRRDGSRTREVLSVQAYLPMAGTPWTLAAALTTPQVDLQEQLLDMVIRCISSVRITDATPPAADAAPEPLGEAPSFDDAIALIEHVVEP